MESKSSITIDAEWIGRVARLAKLELSTEEMQTYQSQLQTIVGHLESLSTQEGERTDLLDSLAKITHPKPDQREDITREQDGAFHEKVIKSAPKIQGRAFQVPKIFE